MYIHVPQGRAYISLSSASEQGSPISHCLAPPHTSAASGVSETLSPEGGAKEKKIAQLTCLLNKTKLVSQRL